MYVCIGYMPCIILSILETLTNAFNHYESYEVLYDYCSIYNLQQFNSWHYKNSNLKYE